MYLCIDTATEQSGIALVGNGIKSNFLPLDRAHTSDDILKKIDHLIQISNSRLSGIKGVFVIKGPGSFTGLRVGIAVGNQFAHQLEIPIIGLYCDELYSYKIQRKDYFYLQSMNTDQVYMVGYGKYKRSYPREIVSISECHYELVSKTGPIWIGQLSKKHREKFESIMEISDIISPKEMWLKLAQGNSFKAHKKYELVEPYYGKLPTITKSKKIYNTVIL